MKLKPTDRADVLRRIRTFAQLFQYLIDVAGWPLNPDELEDDDLSLITYDWNLDELGISPKALPA